MRHETLFGRSGFYRFLLESNVLMHREAADYACRVVRAFLRRRVAATRVKVLDLACGGLPVTISAVMGRCAPAAFDYTGIDINPEQVERARSRFDYPANVMQMRIIEGNAWEPRDLGLEAGYDIVYSGMNLHHGTPEELSFLALELHKLLSSDGIFISHDVYRSADQPYQRRPDTDPDDARESLRMVSEASLASADLPTLKLPAGSGPVDSHWRLDYVERMRKALIARGGDPRGARLTADHMRQRDYPLSTREFCLVFQAQGFNTRVLRYESSQEPLAPYIAMPVASKGDLDWL